MKRLLGFVALALTTLTMLFPAHAEAQRPGRVGDTGIHPSCSDVDWRLRCYEVYDDCLLVAYTPVLTSPMGNDKIKMHNILSCGSGKDRLKLGNSLLYRYDCEYLMALSSWSCNQRTNVGDTTNFRYCGYSDHPDAASCEPKDKPDGTDGYDMVQMVWTYDVKDSPAICHGFQNEANSLWFDRATSMPLNTPEARTAGHLYGPLSHGHSCTGNIGTWT